MSTLAPCSPMGFSLKDTDSNASFWKMPAQIVRQATESNELLDTCNVLNTLLSCNASPNAMPPLLDRELKESSKCVREVLKASDWHNVTAPSRRMRFQPNFNVLRGQLGVLSRSASASPTVTSVEQREITRSEVLTTSSEVRHDSVEVFTTSYQIL